MLVGGDETARLQALLDALCDLSLRDGLTGLVNATFFRASLARDESPFATWQLSQKALPWQRRHSALSARASAG